MRDTNWFKGESPEHYSKSVVVSFSDRWRPFLRENRIKLVLRRRVPKTFVANTMFLYIGSPTSCVIGVASILRIEHLSRIEANSEMQGACISEKEIAEYFEGYSEIGAYRISNIRFFKEDLPFKFLKREAGFSPPQSFVRISKQANDWFMGHALESANG